MALGNVVSNFLIFSVGIKLLTWKYPIKEKLSIRKMVLNNINIAVILGFIVCILQIPMPDVLGKLLSYLSNITSGMSMLVVGLSLSRLPVKAVFQDRRMILLTLIKQIAFPLLILGLLRIVPVALDDYIKKCHDPDSSPSGIFGTVHDHGTVRDKYNGRRSFCIYDNTI
ncbi:MAG: AEC family transporter [Eubacterium ramulus]